MLKTLSTCSKMNSQTVKMNNKFQILKFNPMLFVPMTILILKIHLLVNNRIIQILIQFYRKINNWKSINLLNQTFFGIIT